MTVMNEIFQAGRPDPHDGNRGKQIDRCTSGRPGSSGRAMTTCSGQEGTISTGRRGILVALLGVGLLALSVGCRLNEGPASGTAVTFEKHTLTDSFLAEGVDVGDINRDGSPDVVAGSFWYEGPDWTPHEFRVPKTFDPDTTWSDSFFNHTVDVNGDGWPDILRIGLPGGGFFWYENPQDTTGHWTRHRVHPSVNNEAPRFVDVNGDDRVDVLFADGETEQMVWYEITESPDSSYWRRHVISEPGAPGTDRFAHGIGYGDLNGDGRRDVFVRGGWWEAPPDRTTGPWTFHPADLGGPAAQMHAHDFDGDGDQDVVSSSAHDYGIWWHERIAPPEADSSWTTHLIHESFSQTHALLQRDLDGDGHPDLITGKRYFAHNGKDPGGREPAVLYWFEFRPEGERPTWIPHPIDESSGIGVELEYVDVIGDDRPDIVVANKKGVFVFERTS